MALSDIVKGYQKQEKVKVIDLLKEQELLKAKYFDSDDIPFIVRHTEKNEFIEKQMVSHYKEVSNALKRYLQIEDILNGVYAEYTIVIQGFRFTVATGLRLLKEMEMVDHDKITGHLIISSHPMAVFLNKCYGGQMNYLPENTYVLDPNDLLGDMTIEDVSYRVEEFRVELKYAIEKFNNETVVVS